MKQLKVGLQLYTVRQQMQEDMDKALAEVKKIGYDYVEFAGFFGKTAEEVKALLKKHELTAISVHQGPNPWLEGGQAVIDYLKEIGVKYCAIPSHPAKEYHENWENTMKLFAEYGKVLKEVGIAHLYHNHDYEFTKIDGETIFDKLYASVPAELLNPQIDTCWVHYAGYDPAEYIRKYAGRVEVVHLKDFVCEAFGGGPVYELIEEKQTQNRTKEENGFKFKPVGEGIQDWNAILTACAESGTEYVIVEQDQSYDESAMECARRSRSYLKNTFNI